MALAGLTAQGSGDGLAEPLGDGLGDGLPLGVGLTDVDGHGDD
jgi:hypothetical protein